MAKLPILLPEEKRKLQVLEDIYKQHTFMAFSFALIEIWNKGTNHFTETTLNASILYFKELSQKKESKKSLVSCECEINIETFEVVKLLVKNEITVFDIMRFNARKKIY